MDSTLKDPNNTRIVKSVQPPPAKPIPSQLLFKNNTVDWRYVKNFIKRQETQPNLIRMQDPVTIVGDIHGQYYDLCKLIQNDVGGDPQQNKYVFLGDYVDRGNFSIQVLILILSLKICYPKTVVLLRGNHQCRQLTGYFNFRTQCLKKYDQQTYQLIMNLFDCLPLSCIINEKFLCVHGGISHQLKNLNDIQIIDRFKQIPKGGLFCDLVWADPVDSKTGQIGTLVKNNQARGCSYFFGNQLVSRFFDKNKIISVIRAHEAQQQGFKMHKWAGNDKFPSVITIFSAPDYCGYYGNKGAVIKFVQNTLNIQQFVQSPHPYLLPNFLDLFSWSIPFLIQKTSEVFYHLVKPGKKYKNSQLSVLPFQFLDKRQLLEQVINQHKKITQQNLQMVKLQGHCPDDKLLQTGKYSQTIRDSFSQKKIIDSCNQSRPNY